MYRIIHIPSSEITFVLEENYLGFSTRKKLSATLIECCNTAKCKHLSCETCPWNEDSDAYNKYRIQDFKAEFACERINHKEYKRIFDELQNTPPPLEHFS